MWAAWSIARAQTLLFCLTIKFIKKCTFELMSANIDYQLVMDDIYNRVCTEENEGQVANYIPELSKIDPNKFGVCLRLVDGKVYGVGDWETKFSIQSISKVLALSMVYKTLGDDMWRRVGVEPSGTPFNSLLQLETDHGIPRNPFINAGAMVVCDMLISSTVKPLEEFLTFIRSICSNTEIEYSEKIANSERSVGFRNKALCNFIKSLGNIENDPEDVLEFYFNMCSIEMTCKELTSTFMYLVDDHYQTNSGRSVLSMSQAKRINAIMQTCGFYDESGEFSFKVGLPGKSGVGGGILALHPDKYCIAAWSPKLNAKGNSSRGMKFLEAFTTETKLSIF